MNGPQGSLNNSVKDNESKITNIIEQTERLQYNKQNLQQKQTTDAEEIIHNHETCERHQNIGFPCHNCSSIPPARRQSDELYSNFKSSPRKMQQLTGFPQGTEQLGVAVLRELHTSTVNWEHPQNLQWGSEVQQLLPINQEESRVYNSNCTSNRMEHEGNDPCRTTKYNNLCNNDIKWKEMYSREWGAQGVDAQTATTDDHNERRTVLGRYQPCAPASTIKLRVEAEGGAGDINRIV